MYHIIGEDAYNLRVKLFDFNPSHTFLCGQCFRWNKDASGLWTGIVSGRKLELLWDGEVCTFLDMDEKEFVSKWVDYFDLQTDYSAIKKTLRKKDRHLEKAIDFGEGIRLLQQDLWETLLSFLISQNNGIPRIKQIVEILSLHYGIPLEDTNRGNFPTIPSLAMASLEELQLCRGGYRCKYISSVAKKLYESPSLLGHLRQLPTDEARNILLELPGIGTKVADCILLYSGIDRSVFPVDRWVKRVMESLYFKREASEDAIRAFSKDYFGDLAGYAQQYLFYYAREQNI